MSHQITPFGLRMPDDLKSRVQALARAEDRSVNSFIVRTLREVVDAEKSASAS
jgi:predicted transcriptional regulator